MFDAKNAVARPEVKRGRTKAVNPFIAGMPNLVKISAAGKAAPLTLTGEDTDVKNRERIVRQVREAAKSVDANGKPFADDYHGKPVWTLCVTGLDNYKEGSGEPYTYTVWLTDFTPRPRKTEVPASE